MSMQEGVMFQFEENLDQAAKIKVIGVGGGGGNAINTMIRNHVEGVDFLVANTDAQALRRSEASMKIQLGGSLTKGLGAGANPEIGRQAAEEDVKRLVELFTGADMIFIAAGMGGGTGTTAHTRSNKNQIRTGEEFDQALDIFFSGLTTDFGIGAGTKTFSQASAELNFH